MPEAPLGELDSESVSNVYIFLADALRYDELPEAVSSQGITFKTVAHALATPQCLPTIASGRLPPKHGVTWFQHTIPDGLPTIFDIEEHNTGYSELLWPGHALQDVLGNPGETDLESVEEPFVIFEHDNGGHAPYPELDADNPAEMLRQFESQDELRDRYRETVAGSAERFAEQVDILEDRGILDDTLVIFLADHGQLLGERGGFFGHGLPMTPEIAYVPTVFIHPSLPSDARGEHLLHHVDLYPTIVRALAKNSPESDGDDLTEPVSKDRPAYSQGVMQPPAKFRGSYIDPGYDAKSIWTKGGGHVFVRNPRLVRCVTAVYEATKSGNTGAYNSHRNLAGTLFRMFNQYLRNYHNYSSPSVSKREAESLLSEIDTEIEEQNIRELGEETKQQLENLGYQ